MQFGPTIIPSKKIQFSHTKGYQRRHEKEEEG